MLPNARSEEHSLRRQSAVVNRQPMFFKAAVGGREIDDMIPKYRAAPPRITRSLSVDLFSLPSLPFLCRLLSLLPLTVFLFPFSLFGGVVIEDDGVGEAAAAAASERQRPARRRRGRWRRRQWSALR